MQRDNLEFFRALFGTIPQGAAIEVRITADPERDAGVNRAVPAYSKFYKNIEDLPGEWRDDAHVWFGVGLRASGKRDPILWPSLWVDLDEGGRPNLPSTLPPPTAIVRSGKGLHLYWRLTVPILEREECRGLLRGLRSALGSDVASAEPARVLRVPGTVNVKYSPPLPCELVELHPERVYAIETFRQLPVGEEPERVSVVAPIAEAALPWEEAATRLPQLLKTLAWSGTDDQVKEHFESWSHFDFALCCALADAGYNREQIKGFFTANPQMAVSQRRKNGKPMVLQTDYLHRTIHNAAETVEKRKSGAQHADKVGLRVVSGALHAVDKKGELHMVANFDAEPIAHVLGEGRGIEAHLIREDGYKRDMYLSAKALSSRVLFKQAIDTTYVWEGSDTDLSAFHKYLLRPGLPVKQGTRMLGWHGDWLVTSAGVWNKQGPVPEAPLIYVGQEEWQLVNVPDWRGQAQEALRLLLRLHQPEVTWALLGWTMTTMVAPKIRRARGGNASEAGEFSGLWVWGEPGSGKSRTVAQFLRLTASPFINLAGAGTSIAGLHSVFSEVNALPIFLDDPRTMFSRERDTAKHFQAVLHHAFLGSPVRKGTKDHSRATMQPLMGPCIGTSEQAIEGDEAFAERYLHIPMDKGYKNQHRECARVLDVLTEMSLEELAGGFYQHLWEFDGRPAWKRAMQLTEPLRAGGAEDRVRKTIAQILVGLELAAEIGELDYGMSYSAIAERLHEFSYEDRGLRPNAGYSERLADLLRLIWNLIQDGELREGADFRIVGDAMYVSMIRLRHKAEERSRWMPVPFTQSVILRLLSKNVGDLVSGFARTRFAGGAGNEPYCAVINLSAVKKKIGLTEEPWLSARTELSIID